LTHKYSSILQDFAAPLFSGNENKEECVSKFKVAELIWNHCIAEEFRLPVFSILDSAIQENSTRHPEMKEVFLMMKEIKSVDFKAYKNFIVTTEYRINSNGTGTLYVESIDPHELKHLES
jgi:hypothetical protein